MIKYCPITSGRGNTYSYKVCEEEKCAFWDEEKKQCCIKTMALAAAGKADVETGNGTGQAYCFTPSSYCTTNPVNIPTRDYPATTVYCSTKTDPNYSFETGV